ncbi:MAG: rubrerythrin family protein [Deltaproteobacteria bacterium]|nr:rubrerythrin family protein [Deltaproteobacteria bacterium]
MRVAEGPMLHLAAPTRPDWVVQAVADPESLLLDHAQCEKKAAGTALNLMFRYADQPWLQRPLSELAREELEHFELCMDVLRERGWAFRKLNAGPYGARLMQNVRRGEPHRLLDTLLVCALIEARSCERMKLLSKAFLDSDPQLAELYRSLLASEARHHMLYSDLATEHFGREVVRPRLKALAQEEARVLTELAEEARPMRMHS